MIGPGANKQHSLNNYSDPAVQGTTTDDTHMTSRVQQQQASQLLREANIPGLPYSTGQDNKCTLE
jgi:hypothetical protein